jgi:hypothetical protein
MFPYKDLQNAVSVSAVAVEEGGGGVEQTIKVSFILLEKISIIYECTSSYCET